MGHCTRRLVTIPDIPHPARSDGFTTEWVLACSWCALPVDYGDHAECDVIIAAAWAAAHGAPVGSAAADTLRAPNASHN